MKIQKPGGMFNTKRKKSSPILSASSLKPFAKSRGKHVKSNFAKRTKSLASRIFGA